MMIVLQLSTIPVKQNFTLWTFNLFINKWSIINFTVNSLELSLNSLYFIRLDQINKQILRTKNLKLRKYIDFAFIYKTISVLKYFKLETEV